VTYSGTVASALEATLQGVPAFAMSAAGDGSFDFQAASLCAGRLAKEILRRGLPRDTLLNVNVPNLPPDKLKGWAVTRQGAACTARPWFGTWILAAMPITGSAAPRPPGARARHGSRCRQERLGLRDAAPCGLDEPPRHGRRPWVGSLAERGRCRVPRAGRAPLSALLLGGHVVLSDPRDLGSYALPRERMVVEQLERRGIRDPRVLRAIGKVPRHLFVDEALVGRAYGITRCRSARGRPSPSRTWLP